MAAFVDTNILIYAFPETSTGPNDKVAIARSLLHALSANNELVVSAQVLGEFYVNAIRKSKPPLTHEQAMAQVFGLGKERVVPIDAPLVQLALRRVQQSRLSYWDALIVEAALRFGATLLYTEDMHSGTRFGPLELRNPFLP